MENISIIAKMEYEQSFEEKEEESIYDKYEEYERYMDYLSNREYDEEN